MDPELVPLTKKYRFLGAMDEDRFRDHVVRPLFLRKGLKDGRDLCGPQEQGKDAVFVTEDPFGTMEVWAVQTKRGRLNMASDAKANVVTAETQLRTALKTKVTILGKRQRLLPSKVILCVSGSINAAARDYLHETLDDARLMFMDRDDLVPAIDEVYPELWLGIDPDIYPYLRAVKRDVESASDMLAVVDLLPNASVSPAAKTDYYVPLRLYRLVEGKHKGRTRRGGLASMEEIPVEGVLKKRGQRRALIMGGAGSGKSTALKRLAYVTATASLSRDANHEFPIMLRATQVAGAGAMSVVDLAQRETRRLTGREKVPFTAMDLIEGRVIFLIDALDEVSMPEARKTVLGRLSEVHNQYPECPIIVTARDSAEIRATAGAAEYVQYSISAISLKQAAQIVAYVKRGAKVGTEDAEEVLRRLQEVHGIDLNPLLVTVFAATSEYCGRDVPANITELFKKYTEMMIGRWDASKGLAQQYQAPMKDFLLRQVGLRMHRRKSVRISREEFEAIVREELSRRDRHEEVRGVVEELLTRSGLFRWDDGGVEFRHLLLQEFFAGRGVPRAELTSVLADPWWRRAVVFYFGEHPDESELFEELRTWAEGQDIRTQFEAAISLGLAVQASYLVEGGIKTSMLYWIVKTFAAAKRELLEGDKWIRSKPLLGYIAYYLSGKESVAVALSPAERTRLVDEWAEAGGDKSRVETERFWRIVALQEMGALAQAEELMRGFAPKDRRLLLGVFLGCVFIQRLRVTRPEERRRAKHLGDRVAGKARPLIRQLVEELQSTILELRKGKIAAIELPAEAEAE